MTEPPVYGEKFLFDEEGGSPLTVDEFVDYLWKEYPECMDHGVEQILDGFRRAEKQKKEMI